MGKGNLIKRTIKFDEFILAFKYFMKNKKVAHVSGICDADLLRKNMSEEELSAIFFRALKHNVFVKQGNDIHINFDIYRILNAYATSDMVVTLQNPVYEGKRLVSFAKVGDLWIALQQNAEKNEVTLLVDNAIDTLYDLCAPDIKKGKNKDFHPKKVNKQLEKMGSDVRFGIDYVYQFVMLAVNNHTGKQFQDAVLFHVGKKSFDVLTGEVENNHLESFSVEQLDDKVLENIERILSSNTEDHPESGDDNAQKKEQREKNKEPEDETYTKFSFQRLSENQNFPHGIIALLKVQILNWIKQFTNLKRLAVLVIAQLVFALLVLLWNMYGMCYLNDTFRISPESFLGSATAYLFGGTVGSRNELKGMSFLKKDFNTVLISGSFYCLFGIWFRSLLGTILHGKVLESISNYFGFPRRIRQYVQRSDRNIRDYIWTGVIIAAPIGFLLWNPFTTVLLAMLLMMSCVKADDSSIAVPVMLFRSASCYQKVMEGKKKRPLFADVELRLFGISIGFFAYSAVNLIIWLLFDYNIWVRLIFTVLLVIMALFGLGILKINKPEKVAACLVMLVVCSVLVMLANNGIVLADDGGWTESGGTLAGLFTNAGFATILGISTLMAVTTLGGSLVVAGIFGGIVTSGSFVWSSTTETGRKTAADFMLGDYSPYGGDSAIAAGLNVAVGLVPGIGEAWGLASGMRDSEYNFSNGNELSGIFNLVCAGLSLKGLGEGIDLAAKGLVNATSKTVIKSTLKRGILENTDNVFRGVASGADDVARGVASGADDVARGVASGADDVAREAASGADDVARGVASGASNVSKPSFVEKVVAGHIAGKFTNGLLANQTNAVKKAMVQNVENGLASSLRQGIEGACAEELDNVLNERTVSVPKMKEPKVVSGSTIDNRVTTSLSMDKVNADPPQVLQPTPLETIELVDQLSDEEILNIVEIIAKSFEDDSQIPTVIEKLREYLETKGKGPIDRKLLKDILEAELNQSAE